MEHQKDKKQNIDVISLNVPYIKTPTKVYKHLCQQSNYSLLLESAEINSKQNLKSLMLIDAAARMVCRGLIVEIQANTSNGKDLLDALEKSLQNKMIQCSFTRKSNLLILDFSSNKTKNNHQDALLLDEETRLHQTSPFDAIRLIQKTFQYDNLPENALMIGGLFAYDLVAQFEPLPQLQSNHRCPDFVFYISEILLIIDHQQNCAKLQATSFSINNTEKQNLNFKKRLRKIEQQLSQPQTSSLLAPSNTLPCDIEVSITDDAFCTMVDSLKRHIVEGDIFQVVPSRTFKIACPAPFQAYAKLKQTNPSPYMFYMHDIDFILFGASPESALKYTKLTNQVEIYPIAGTRPRGKKADNSVDLDLDARIELELRNDKKENAEHMMLVDLARNDIARISKPGSRYVAQLLNVDRYSHVMHLVSKVIGQLADELDGLHAYQACMNMGTLTGAPKIRAMQLISEVEQTRRGSYGGAVGYINGAGDIDTCIVIRSAYVEDNIAYVQAGAGVVFDSIAQAEADETRAKAQAVLHAISHAQIGDKI